MIDLLPGAAVGAGTVAVAYVGYVAVRKGVPAAWSLVKGWWTSGATALNTVKGDIADAHAKIAALETKVAALVQKVGL